MTGTVILALGERDLALGLEWHSLRRGQRLLWECARLARQQRATLALLGKGWRQFALARASYVPAAGRPCYSAALAACSALQQGTVFAAFLLEGGVYVISRVNGQFLPDGDRYFENEDEARASFQRYQQSSHWATAGRYAPQGWEIPGTTELALDDLLAQAPPTVALRRPPIHPGIKMAVAGAVMAAVAGASYAAVSVGRSTVRKVAVYEALPTEVQGLGREAVACAAAAGRVKVEQIVPGWPFSKWQCSGGNVSATFLRKPKAPRSWAIQQPGWTVSDDLESATLSLPVGMEGDPEKIDPDRLLSEPEAQRLVRLVAGTLKGVVPSFSTAPPRLIGSGDAPTRQPDWMRLNWTLTVSAPPAAWIAPLGSLPATVLGLINHGEDKTTITGTTYVRR
jgi:hypothetical protein